MLKISPVGKPGKDLLLRLEGSLVGPWVAELQKVCEGLIDDGVLLVLDLAEVSFADEEGIALLASFQKRGVKFQGTTPFLQEQLKPTARFGG